MASCDGGGLAMVVSGGLFAAGVGAGVAASVQSESMQFVPQSISQMPSPYHVESHVQHEGGDCAETVRAVHIRYISHTDREGRVAMQQTVEDDSENECGEAQEEHLQGRRGGSNGVQRGWTEGHARLLCRRVVGACTQHRGSKYLRSDVTGPWQRAMPRMRCFCA